MKARVGGLSNWLERPRAELAMIQSVIEALEESVNLKSNSGPTARLRDKLSTCRVDS
jgi:hypothetical protein